MAGDGNAFSVVLVGVLLCAAGIASAQPPPSCPAVCNCANYATKKEIRCENVDLASVPSFLPPDTQSLRLEFNSITSIGAGDFAGLVALKRLILYNNRISYLDPDAFHDQENLEVLRLQNNAIARVDFRTFMGMRKLVELNMANNLLTTMPNDTFRDLVKLKELTISGNPLETLHNGVFDALSNLQHLDISEVHFDTLQATLFNGLTNLGVLKLNNITQNGDSFLANEDIFAGVPNLTELQVRRNSLTCIPASFLALSRVETLYLSQNPMNCGDLSGIRHMRYLVELHLENTEMTTLKSRTFVTTPNITYLDVSESRLSEVEGGAFEGLSRLVDLFLYLNNLTTLPEDVFESVPNSVEIDLSDNPWNCDCNLRWLREWINVTHTGVIDGAVPTTCASPDRLRDRELVNIPAPDFACPPESNGSGATHTADQDEDYVIQCGIFGDPSPALHWLTPDHSELLPGTTNGPIIVDDDCTLTIIRIQESDAGTYSCIGNNIAGSRTVSHKITVQATGIGRQTPTSPTQGVISSVPMTGKKSSQVIFFAGIAGGIVLIVLLVLAVVCFVRVKRKNGRNGPMESALVFQNESFAGRNCEQGCHNQVMFPLDVTDARYADSRPQITDKSSFDPPPPYSTLPAQETYEEIYDQINDGEEENAYERPRQPGEITPQSTPQLNHTYSLSQLQRQASKLSESSCNAPSGYECSMIRSNFKRGNHYSIDSGTFPRELAPDIPNDRAASKKSEDVDLPKTKTTSKEDEVDARGVGSDKAKTTYQNIRRF